MGIDTNTVDPDQTAPIGSGSSLFVKEASKCLSRQQKHASFVICALRVNTYEVSVYTIKLSMKCTHVCAAQKAY